MSKVPVIRAPRKSGLSVIEASAGSGKTWTVAHLVPLYLIEGAIQRLDEMVLVTFTEAAAGELAGRVRENLARLVQLIQADQPAPASEPGLGELLAKLDDLRDKLDAQGRDLRDQAVLRLERALDEADRLLAGTIHSFCRRVLVDEAFLCGVPAGFKVLTDLRALRSNAVRDLWRSRIATDPLLAQIATMNRWGVEADLKLATMAARREGVRIVPAPDLDVELQNVRDALAGLRKSKPALLDYRKRYLALTEKGVEPSKKPEGPTPGKMLAWAESLEALDANAPDAKIFEIAKFLGQLPGWLKKGGLKGDVKKELEKAVEEFESLPLVAFAQGLNGGLAMLQWAWKRFVETQSGAKVEQALSDANALDFDRLILRLRDALTTGKGSVALKERLRRRWKMALVDESQDTDAAQLQVFSQIFDQGVDGGTRLVLVGDPKQSIYSFRGADLRAYLKAKQNAVETIALDQTFRSAPGLVDCLNAFFERAQPALGDLDVPKVSSARQDKDLPLPAQDDPGQGARLVAMLVPKDQRDGWGSVEDCRDRAARAAASAVVDLLNAGGGGLQVDPGGCAVLTSSNAEARAMADALKDRGVPAIIQKNGDVFESEAAGDWRILLAAVLDPDDAGARRAAMATRLLACTASELAGLDDETDELWRRRFLDCQQAWRQGGFSALRAALEAELWGQPFQRLARRPDGERLVTDSRHFLELADAAAREQDLSPEGLLEWIENATAGEDGDDEIAAEERERRLEKDATAVQIMTQHGAKGLEYDYVFCPYLWNNGAKDKGAQLFADADGRWTLSNAALLEKEEAEAIQETVALENLCERLRLTYVALTRAKRRVWVLAGWMGYRERFAQAPSPLDWMLRPVVKGQVENLRDWYKALKERKKLTELAGEPACYHESALEILAKKLGPLVQVLPLEEHRHRFNVPVTSEPFPAARLKPAKLDFKTWSTASFSQLTKDEHDKPHVARTAIEVEAGTGRVPLADFPRGKNPGLCLHRILEHWNFKALDPAVVTEALRHYGFKPEDHQALLEKELPKFSRAVVPVLETSLAAVADLPRLSELDFLLPIEAGKSLQGDALADLFASHGSDELKGYADQLRGISGQAVGGMLTGSIDRMVRDGRRWAIVDWKSNYLGDHAADYSRERLWTSACDNHYVLQQALYAVAARRYLALRGQGEMLNTVCLAYLRGLAPDTQNGFLNIVLPEPLLQALDHLFALPIGAV